MVNRTSDRSEGAALATACGVAAVAGPAGRNVPRTARSADAFFPKDVTRIATSVAPRFEYSTRSGQVTDARQGLQLGEGRLRGESFQVRGRPEQDPITGRETSGRAQDGHDRFRRLDPLGPSVRKTKPQHEPLLERDLLQQLVAGGAPNAVAAQPGQAM